MAANNSDVVTIEQFKNYMVQRNAYRDIDYIESTGTQYINTGIIPNQNTRVVLNCVLVDAKEQFILGSRTSMSATDTYTIVVLSTLGVRTDYGTEKKEISGLTMSDGSYLNIDKDKNKTVINNKSLTVSAKSFTGTYPLFLCACNTSGKYEKAACIRIMSCDIYDNGKLVRSYLPKIRNEDNVAGLYDGVSGVFYTNAGTGEFLTPGQNDAGNSFELIWEGNSRSISNITLSDYDVIAIETSLKYTSSHIYKATTLVALNLDTSGTQYATLLPASGGTSTMQVSYTTSSISLNGGSTSVNISRIYGVK